MSPDPQQAPAATIEELEEALDEAEQTSREADRALRSARGSRPEVWAEANKAWYVAHDAQDALRRALAKTKAENNIEPVKPIEATAKPLPRKELLAIRAAVVGIMRRIDRALGLDPRHPTRREHDPPG